MLQRFLPTLALALSLLCSHADAQKVWVVRPVAGHGIDFTDIKTAVDTAADGDTLLVHYGTYGPLVVAGKGLHVIADNGGNKPRFTSVVYRDQLPGQSSSLVGFTSYGGLDFPALKINNSKGGIWVEDCDFYGKWNPASAWFEPKPDPFGFEAMHILDSISVTLSDCFLGGGSGGSDDGSGGTPAAGGPAIKLHSSFKVYIRDSVIRGGYGGSGDFDGAPVDGANGGNAVEMTNGSLTLLNSQLFGGNGGVGGDDGYGYGLDGYGGNGIVCDSAYSSLAHIRIANLTITPGLVTWGTPAFVNEGVPFILSSAVLIDLETPATRLNISTPVRTGGTVQINSQAPAGFIRMLLLSSAPIWQNQGLGVGIQLIDLSSPFIMPLAGLPDQFSVPASLTLPVGTHLTLFGQLVTFDPHNPRTTFGAISTVTILDATL